MKILPLAGLLVLAGHGPYAPSGGHLVIVGGGGTTDAIVEKALALAGGKSARMVVLAQASARENAGEGSVRFWTEKGATSVTSLDLADREAAAKAIAQADLIWFPGGDQNRLLRAITEADLAGAIRARYQAGAVVGGTSAGAAVMSPAMIVGGESADLKAVRSGGTTIAEGLGLFPDSIVDQHFLARQRFNRLLAAVLDRPKLVGIGIDEKTAIVCNGRSFEVVGEGGVLVLDARKAALEKTEEGGLPGGTGVQLAFLRPGMRFDLGP